MFFSQIWAWLSAQLAYYVGLNTSRMAMLIEPAAVALGTIYVMLWGYLSWTGRLQEPLIDGVKRILILALVFGVGLQLWAYNAVIVDTVFNAPVQLAAGIVGSANPVLVVDTIWDRGGSVASELWNKGGVLSGDVGFYLAAMVVYLLIGSVAVYTMFLLCLSKIALSLILVLGPIFIVFLLFDATKRFFEAWVAMLANYALVTVLVALGASLLLQIVQSYATQTAARGAAIVTVDALNMVLVAALILLILRQIPSMASGLASGIALSSFGAVSGVVSWGLGKTKRTGYEFGRGLLDGANREPTSRWDSLTRSAGNKVASGIRGAAESVGGSRTGGTMVPRERIMPRRTYR